MNQDNIFMMQAIKEAKKAYKKDEVPVGCVLVHDNKIIARAHNQVEMLKDPTAHAEMICITMGSSFFNNWRLEDTTLYTTLEPCTMCAGAIILARIKRLVWSAPDKRVGANGSFIDIFEKDHPIHNIEITKNVLEEYSSELMVEFFKTKRKSKLNAF